MIVLSVLVIFLASTGEIFADTPREAKVVATYFHGTFRCQTCLNIESLARFNVTDVMADDIEDGLLVWRLVNYDKEENVHFEKEFGLEGPTLVVTLEQSGEILKWERLDRVWDLYSDVPAFDKYVLKTLEGFLDSATLLEPQISNQGQ